MCFLIDSAARYILEDKCDAEFRDVHVVSAFRRPFEIDDHLSRSLDISADDHIRWLTNQPSDTEVVNALGPIYELVVPSYGDRWSQHKRIQVSKSVVVSRNYSEKVNRIGCVRYGCGLLIRNSDEKSFRTILDDQYYDIATEVQVI